MTTPANDRIARDRGDDEQDDAGFGRGLAFAIASVVLVSIAQLLLKFGVAHVELAASPDWTDWRALLAGIAPVAAWLPLLGGIGCYGASVFCWLAALGRLPLNVAYPLLSLSYPLVYAGAALLPFFSEALNTQRLAGTALIMLGVVLLVTGPRR